MRALEVELLDVASDRVERQRAYSRGALLPATPDVSQLSARLASKGLAKGNPIYIRIFKASSELELWMLRGDQYVLLDVYPICHWTGTLGPKLREGDRQSPEGFYSVSARQMRLVGRWRSAFNLGFPNAYDQLNKRTGSYILVHGGCSSTGCFAMTDLVQDEIYGLADAAHKQGQARFHVHVFPFRMTDENITAHADSPWVSFWQDLRVAYDTFERTRVPPRVEICGLRYSVSDGDPADRGEDNPLTVLRPVRTASISGTGPVCREEERPARHVQTSSVGPQAVQSDAAESRQPKDRGEAKAAAPAAERILRRRAPRVREAVVKTAPARPARAVRSSVPVASPVRSTVARAGASQTPAAPPQSNGLGQLVDARAPRVVQYGQ
ncbi:MAG TPA: murein L,D-transpeptidase family protein [Hyphomicrobiaceae bacterium]|nr:murein L,D-transpeptidase family protein [Hyphomicrobiaceae bacterium]